MKFNVKCWKCQHKFTAYDELIGENDYNCPRCGKRTATILFTPEQVKKHVPYRNIGSGTVLHIGYEVREVVPKGYYVLDKNDNRMRLDEGIPLLGA